MDDGLVSIKAVLTMLRSILSDAAAGRQQGHGPATTTDPARSRQRKGIQQCAALPVPVFGTFASLALVALVGNCCICVFAVTVCKVGVSGEKGGRHCDWFAAAVW